MFNSMGHMDGECAEDLSMAAITRQGSHSNDMEFRDDGPEDLSRSVDTWRRTGELDKSTSMLRGETHHSHKSTTAKCREAIHSGFTKEGGGGGDF